MNPPAAGIRLTASWIVTLLIPFLLLMTSIRILMTPLFPQIEYRTPGFPADPYGFTLDDRLHWSRIAMNYLLNNADISYLGDLRFPDGSPLYNQRELSHMVDVKNLVQAALKFWIGGLAVLALLSLWAWFGKWWGDYRRGLAWGGWLTVGLIVAILVFVAINFSQLFTDFHRIFFTGDSWLFLFSDTLIRLFPLPFWQDAFIAMGGMSLLGGLALGFFFRPRLPRG